MKKIKLLAAVALAGFMGLSARASLNGYASVNVKLVILMQTNDTESGSALHYNVNKAKVTTKTILGFVADEFHTNFPPGAQLVVNNFWDGQFSILDKKGNVILADVSTNSAAGDGYELSFIDHNYVYTGKAGNTQGTLNSTAVGEFYYQNAGGANSIDMYGLTTVKEKITKSRYSQSYKIANGDGYLNGDEMGASQGDGVVMGSVSGSGRNDPSARDDVR